MTQNSADDGSKQTTTSVIAAELRTAIQQGQLRPGERLKIDHLKKRFETAVNPVREALNRLVAEGMVDLADHKGFSVATISLEAWRDLLEARCLIESGALRKSILNPTEEWRDEVVVSLHRLLRTPRFHDDERAVMNPEWERIHHWFHRSLLARCGSEVVLSMCDDLRLRSDRYRVIARRARHARTSYNEEHALIADLAIKGDAERAVDELVKHYRATLGEVEMYFKSAS
ncbi:GntR family transcriptional regulator [Brucella sp. 21LCYQ03]|nr:GntR family transcriptional regulator [Brucella sp. 21LCYQ03]